MPAPPWRWPAQPWRWSLSGFSQDQNMELKAAAGSVIITPEENLLMGGFSPNRMALGTYDNLYARCLVLEKSGERLVFVSADLLGLIRYDVLLIKKELAEKHSIKPEGVFIFSTHQHSGPDTIGLWGRIPLATNGRNEKYMEKVRKNIARLAADTVKTTEPAILKISKTESDGFSKNSRESELLDKDIFVLSVRGKHKQIATVVNFGCHPEALSRSNRFVSSDYPGYLCKRLEKELGGTAIFINGILGGMITPNTGILRRPEYNPLKIKYDNVKKCEAMGNILAEWAIKSIPNAKPLENSWKVTTQKIEVPLENHAFKLASKHGIIPKSEGTARDWNVITEVSVIDFGNAKMLLVPGEILPKLGLEIKKMFNAEYVMMFCLANDEIGYVIHPDDWPRDLYKYERSMSVGPEAGKRVREAFKQMAVR